MMKTVVIDCFPESAQRYRNGYAIVVIDVIRATTSISTAISMGTRVFPVQTTDEAFVLASALKDPLLVGELGGNVPYGFDMTNSPDEIARLENGERPMVFISSSGSQLLRNAVGCDAVYTACFRDFSAVANYIQGRHARVAVIGAGTRGEFRREDQMGCAWLAERLIQGGYEVESLLTTGYVSRWKGASPEEIRGGRSAEYLRKTNQEKDLEFIIQHIDDLDTVPALVHGEIVAMAGKGRRL
jgi:2-phosphosulfolactate phosphatase